MSEIDWKRMQQRTLSYLGDRKQEGAFALSGAIEACVEELEKEAHFLGCYEIYDLILAQNGFWQIRDLDLTLESDDIRRLFASCDKVCVVATTLGVSFERYLRRVMNRDMSHGVVLDAAASAYLECRTDIFEEELGLGPHTFRFAPGYGDLDLSLNVVLMKAIKADKKIGLTPTGSGLFVPQKSMLALIGLGAQGTESIGCESCARAESCAVRSRGAFCRR